MTRHKDSPAFIEYLKTVIPTFIGHLKTSTDKHEASWHESNPNWVSGYSELAWEFRELGQLFASLDKISSESKALFVWDIIDFINPKEAGEDGKNSENMEYWLNKDVYEFGRFDSGIIPRLDRYDKENKTDSGLHARSMLFEYANAVCNADGLPLTEIQKKTLSKFEIELFKDNFFELDISPKEYRHENSEEFIIYLETTIADLLPPLKEMDEEMRNIDKFNLYSIRFDLQKISETFAYADKKIKKSEAAFITDINMFLNNEKDYKDFDNKHYQNEIYESVIEYTFLNYLSVPRSVKYLQLYDERNETSFATQAKSMFFKYAKAVTKADGNICEEEQILLSEYKDLLFKYIPDEEEAEDDEDIDNDTYDYELPESKSLDELTGELNSLVGLDKVKNDVAQLVNFLKVQKMREAKGMAVQPLSRHLVFYGNPGTGKTTVARLLSQIYKSLGILSEGHLIETDRAGLVAGYVGQTALNVREVVSEAIGGVLFIDEAYTLSTGGDNDFGREAIDTLLKMMEDNRDDLIVVVAGYTDKMSAFLQTNPGLRSRFNKYLEFEDYTPEQLVEIFELFCTNGGYKLSSTTHDDLIKLFSVLYETRDKTFGNGRLARNLYEMTINNQANRIVFLPNVDDEMLSTIEETDIPGMTDLQSVK